MADVQELLEAAQVLGRAHRVFRLASAEGEQRIEEILDAGIRENEHLLADEGDPDYLDDDLIAAARAYLLTGDDPAGAIATDLRGELDNSRTVRAEDLKSAVLLAEPAKRALESPALDFAAAAQRWLRTTRAEGDVTGWSKVLAAWRKALSLTTREAASALHVSPSAIVRYETGQRSPSLPQLGALVDCIVAWDPTAEEDTTGRSAARAIARLLGDDPDRSTEFLEVAARQRAHLQSNVEDGLERLTVAQLRVVAALVAIPVTLDRLAELAKGDPLRPILDALADVHEVARDEVGP